MPTKAEISINFNINSFPEVNLPYCNKFAFLEEKLDKKISN